LYILLSVPGGIHACTPEDPDRSMLAAARLPVCAIHDPGKGRIQRHGTACPGEGQPEPWPPALPARDHGEHDGTAPKRQLPCCRVQAARHGDVLPGGGWRVLIPEIILKLHIFRARDRIG